MNINIPLVQVEDVKEERNTEKEKEKKRLERYKNLPEWQQKGFASKEEFENWVTTQGLGYYLYHKFCKIKEKK